MHHFLYANDVFFFSTVVQVSLGNEIYRFPSNNLHWKWDFSVIIPKKSIPSLNGGGSVTFCDFRPLSASFDPTVNDIGYCLLKSINKRPIFSAEWEFIKSSEHLPIESLEFLQYVHFVTQHSKSKISQWYSIIRIKNGNKFKKHQNQLQIQS